MVKHDATDDTVTDQRAYLRNLYIALKALTLVQKNTRPDPNRRIRVDSLINYYSQQILITTEYIQRLQEGDELPF